MALATECLLTCRANEQSKPISSPSSPVQWGPRVQLNKLATALIIYYLTSKMKFKKLVYYY